ncbi:MAG: 50S ribosomal protein L10 [Nanoarchaeota archaeon]
MAHISEQKKEIVKNISKLIREYPIIGAVNMENLPAPQLQGMRAQLRDKVQLVMTKRRLIKVALKQSKKEGIEKLEPYLRGMPALIFTKDNPFALFKVLKKSKSSAPAKPGQTAPNDLIVKAGPTSFAPGPIIGELGALGIKCGVEDGKVAIKQDSVVVEEGQIIGAKQAEILTRLGIQPMEVGLDLIATFEDGIIFTKEILNIDEDEFKNKLENAARWAVNLSVSAAYPTKDTIQLLISKSFNDAKAIGLSQNIIDKDIIDCLLGKAERQMQSLKTTANIETKTAPDKQIEEIQKEAPAKELPKQDNISKVIKEEKEIINEERELEKIETKNDAPVEKEVKEAVKEIEEKELEKERIEKEKELSTDSKVAEMVKKMKRHVKGDIPSAEKIVEEIKKEDKEIIKKAKVPSAVELAKQKKESEHKKAEQLASELVKKGSLRK